MANLPGLVAIDVDGTLVADDGLPSERTRAAIGRSREAGVQVVLATGRPFLVVDRTAEALGNVDYLICSNGAMTVRRRDDFVIRDLWLEDGLAEFVVGAVRKRLPDVGFALMFEKGSKSEPGWRERLPANVPLGSPVDDVLTLLPDRGPVRKVMVFHDDYDDDLRSLIAMTQEIVGAKATVTHSGLAFAEVGPVGLHKAVALAALCEDLEVDQSAVVAFGDEINDTEMLEWAGIGVAMANASPEAKAAADVVTASNNDDGVARFLEEILNG
jgi:Cof subfamily protein (haloacid dehalogenase superfamily)